MKHLLLAVTLLLCTFLCLPGKTIPLQDLKNPESLLITGGKMFIVEGAEIHIISLNNFKTVKTFGKKGEGPQEFRTVPGFKLSLLPLKDKLFIRSISRISFFSLEGQFQEEIKTPSRAGIYLPLGDGFAGTGLATENNIKYFTIQLLDSKFAPKKEIFRQKNSFQSIQAGFDPTNQIPPIVICHDNSIFVNDDQGIIHRFDSEGKEIASVKHQYGTLAVTEDHKNKLFEFYKTQPSTRPYFDMIKPHMKFPQHFPPLRDYRIDGDKLYVLPYAPKDNKHLFYIFDLKGKAIGTAPAAPAQHSILDLAPYTIHKGKIYLLVEDRENESWSLQIQKL
jgi:hypothetical protein